MGQYSKIALARDIARLTQDVDHPRGPVRLLVLSLQGDRDDLETIPMGGVSAEEIEDRIADKIERTAESKKGIVRFKLKVFRRDDRNVASSAWHYDLYSAGPDDAEVDAPVSGVQGSLSETYNYLLAREKNLNSATVLQLGSLRAENNDLLENMRMLLVEQREDRKVHRELLLAQAALAKESAAEKRADRAAAADEKLRQDVGEAVRAFGMILADRWQMGRALPNGQPPAGALPPVSIREEPFVKLMLPIIVRDPARGARIAALFSMPQTMMLQQLQKKIAEDAPLDAAALGYIRQIRETIDGAQLDAIVRILEETEEGREEAGRVVRYFAQFVKVEAVQGTPSEGAATPNGAGPVH